jgi:phosphate transport system substrate-binding protein
MAGRGDSKRFAIWAVSIALAALSAGAMFWIWRGGGVRLEPPAAASSMVEECGAVLAGSSAMSARLGPEMVGAFLRQSGYEVSTPGPATDGALEVVGARGELRCTVTVRASTSSQGFRDLAANSAQVVLSQRPITRGDIDMLAAAGAGDFAAERGLAEHVVAFDAYAVAVNAANPLRQIGIDDVRDVALGLKNNWTAFEGVDAPITLYSPIDGVQPDDYPNDLVQHPNPDWARARVRARVVPNEAAAVAALSRDPAGLAFVSAAFLKGETSVRALDIAAIGPARAPTAQNILAESYPLARRLFVYVRPADMRANPFVQRFVAYFTSPEAFDLIDRAGFVALRPQSRMSQVAAHLSGCRFGTAEYAALMSATRGAERLPVELHFQPDALVFDDATHATAQHLAISLRGRLADGATVILVGHADYTGEVAKNRAIGLRRALAARAALEALGVFGLEVESAGEQCPVSDNQTDAGRERNRRVEIWVRPRNADATTAARTP